MLVYQCSHLLIIDTFPAGNFDVKISMSKSVEKRKNIFDTHRKTSKFQRSKSFFYLTSKKHRKSIEKMTSKYQRRFNIEISTVPDGLSMITADKMLSTNALTYTADNRRFINTQTYS